MENHEKVNMYYLMYNLIQFCVIFQRLYITPLQLIQLLIFIRARWLIKYDFIIFDYKQIIQN